MKDDWIQVCAADEIDEEDVLRFDQGDRTYAIYNADEGFFATDGYCTHEVAHLADGLVMGNIIECPLHQGRFDVRNGKAKGAPVCVDLVAYEVKVENDLIYIKLPA